jgi:UDP-glucuronate 4-epimerase
VQESVLITGVAGFIGMHVAKSLIAQGYDIVGIDNLNEYYDRNLKLARLTELTGFPNFAFEKIDIAEQESILELFTRFRFKYVVHLAAQAGVRYSLRDPHAYVDSNIVGFLNVLEGCRHTGCSHLLYASSSSVYGANTSIPFSTSDSVDHPVSFYAATKKANELMAHAYAHLFSIPATGLRFFTVFGPWGRPDMAIWLFTEAIMYGRPIKLFNNGRMRRDFTYVDDVVRAIVRLVPQAPKPELALSRDKPHPATSQAAWSVYNIGNSSPVEIIDVVRLVEKAIGRSAIQELLPMQPGDVLETYADVTDLERAIGFRPSTSIADGIQQFVEWFQKFVQNRR